MQPLNESLFVVEDNNADFRVLKRILKKMDIQTPVSRAETGEEALQKLYHCTDNRDSSKFSAPSIIILDLNLPGTDGRDVLVKLKENQALAKIPVVIFTTSSAPSDIDFCYENGANGYMIKPVGMEQLKDKLQRFVDYWLGANTSPSFVI